MPRLSPKGESMVLISGTAPPEDGKPAAGDYLLRELPVDGGDRASWRGSMAARAHSDRPRGRPDGKQLVFVSREPE